VVLDTTYRSKANTKMINKLLGKPFSFIQSIKMRGIGSKRLIIDEVCPALSKYTNKVSSINYANIELRPKGILIHINKGLQTFSWSIPYYQLVIYNVNGSSIHAQGKFIHFRNNQTFKENKSFFDKLFDEKIKYYEYYKFDFV